MKVLLGVGERAFQIEIPGGSNNPILELMERNFIKIILSYLIHG
jgi:hypothetical protein